MVDEPFKQMLNEKAADVYVKILKEMKGVPTVIEYMGKKYVLHHSDQFKR